MDFDEGMKAEAHLYIMYSHSLLLLEKYEYVFHIKFFDGTDHKRPC